MAADQAYRVILTPSFLGDLDRIDDFYRGVDVVLADRARALIAQGVFGLEQMPYRHPPVRMPGYEGLREAYVPFGRDGFIIRFDLDDEAELVIVARVYHTREDRFPVD